MVVLVFDDESARDERHTDVGHLERLALDDLVGQALSLVIEIVIQV